MDRQKFEQSCAIKFCVKLGESATVTYGKLQKVTALVSTRITCKFREAKRRRIFPSHKNKTFLTGPTEDLTSTQWAKISAGVG